MQNVMSKLRNWVWVRVMDRDSAVVFHTLPATFVLHAPATPSVPAIY